MAFFKFSKNANMPPEKINSLTQENLPPFEKEMPPENKGTESTPGLPAEKMPDLLVAALKMAESIKNLYGDEIGLYISDLNDYLYIKAGKVKLALVAGDAVKVGSTAYQTMRNAARTIVKIGKEVYGLPYIGTGYPLFGSDGKVIGSIVTVTPMERQENLNAIAGQMEGQINTISMAITNFSATSQELSATMENLNGNAQGIREEIKKTDEIVTLIRDISEQTHMLGLNAAIEAARVGDAGRGFNVVAEEIRKLSQDTHRSVKNILEILLEMKNSIVDLTGSIEQISGATQQQTASAQEINSTVNELTVVALELKKQADDLMS